MPKIRIKERDLTTNAVSGAADTYILYVLENTVEADNVLLLEDNVSVPREATSEDIEILEGDGDTHTFLSEAAAYGAKFILADTWENAKAYCGDRNQYDIKFILAKEYTADEETHTELEDALTIALKRKDCSVVLTSLNATLSEASQALCKATCDYITSGKDVNFYSDEVKTPAGKYVTAFYASSPIHKTTSTEHTLEPNEAYIEALLYNLYNGYNDWDAVAGSTRGYVPNGYEVDGFLKEDEIDNMQLRVYDSTYTIAVNPICNVNPWGLRIWGNRTALPNTNVGTWDGSKFTPDDAEGSAAGSRDADQLVASSFANTRVLLSDIKKQLYQASRKYQFEQNTDILWVNFKAEVNTLLEEMKQSYGISGYRWTLESTSERAKLKAKLTVMPIASVEDFDLTVELNDGELEVEE